MRPEFWRGKSVFLTGHTGFKGGWLSLWLGELGARVTGYALAPDTTPDLFTAAKIADGITHITGDVRDMDALHRAMASTKPDIVIHMAAQALVRYSYDHPVDTYATNVMGTVHVLEAVRRIGGAQATLIVTSDKCYENREHGRPYAEGDAMGGHDPYSSSKGCAELVTSAYGKSYFACDKKLGALASVRAGNVIGGGDWTLDRLVPDIIRALSKNTAPIVRHPRAVRPWQHVLEPLSGYLAAIEHIAAHTSPVPDAWNFAPDANSQIPVWQVAEGLCAAWGSGISPVIQEDKNAVHEANLLTLDAGKAHRELGWSPRWDLPATLEQTARWYRAYEHHEDMRAFSLAQIRDYTNYARSQKHATV